MARGNFWFRRWLRQGDTTALAGDFWFRRWVRRGQGEITGEAWFRRAVVSGEAALARLSPEFIDVGIQDANTAQSAIGFTYPDDVRADDLLIAAVSVNDSAGSPNVGDTAAGWTLLHKLISEELCLALFWRRAVGDETGLTRPFSWSAGQAVNDVAVGNVYQFRYADWAGGSPFHSAFTTSLGDQANGINLPAIVTKAKNDLAVAFVGNSFSAFNYSTYPTGFSGGTWLAPRDQSGSQSGNSVQQKLFQAPIAEPGETAGGLVVAPDPIEVISDVFGAIGFSIRGAVDNTDYAIVSASIAASADDAREAISTGVMNLTSTTLFAGTGSIYGLRFAGLSELAGKTIVRANIQVTASGNSGGDNTVFNTINGEAADAAAQYTTTGFDISGRALTAASAVWNQPVFFTGDRNVRQLSADVYEIVQEIVDRPSFSGVLNFIVSTPSGADNAIASWDHATLQEATLTVQYIP